MKKTLFVDMVTGIVLMLISVYWYYEASQMMQVELGIGPAGYPKFTAVGLFILSFILLIQSVSKGIPKPEFKFDPKVVKRTIIFILVTFVYVRAMVYLGFLLLTPPYLFFALWFFEYRKKVIAAITSIGMTAILYVVFRVIFFVALPTFKYF